MSICRKNACRTITIKHQLMFNYRFLNEDSSYTPFISGPTKTIMFHELDVQHFLHLIPQSVIKSVSPTNWVEYLGHEIKRNCIVTIFSEDGSRFYLLFFRLIKYIFLKLKLLQYTFEK